LKVLDLFGGSRSDLPGGGALKVPDMFGGSGSDLRSGGALVFLIYLVAADRICPMVVHWISSSVQW